MQENNIFIYSRESINITGVKSVESFDEQRITLVVNEDFLYVEGENLSIIELDLEKGNVKASGYISSLFFTDSNTNQKQGFFSKIFRG